MHVYPSNACMHMSVLALNVDDAILLKTKYTENWPFLLFFFYIKLALHVTFGLIVLRNPVSIFWKVDEPKTKYFKWRLHGLHTNTFSQTLSHYNSNLYTWHDKKTDFFLGLIDVKNCLSTTGSFQFDEKTHFKKLKTCRTFNANNGVYIIPYINNKE